MKKKKELIIFCFVLILLTGFVSFTSASLFTGISGFFGKFNGKTVTGESVVQLEDGTTIETCYRGDVVSLEEIEEAINNGYKVFFKKTHDQETYEGPLTNYNELISKLNLNDQSSRWWSAKFWEANKYLVVKPGDWSPCDFENSVGWEGDYTTFPEEENYAPTGNAILSGNSITGNAVNNAGYDPDNYLGYGGFWNGKGTKPAPPTGESYLFIKQKGGSYSYYKFRINTPTSEIAAYAKSIGSDFCWIKSCTYYIANFGIYHYAQKKTIAASPPGVTPKTPAIIPPPAPSGVTASGSTPTCPSILSNAAQCAVLSESDCKTKDAGTCDCTYGPNIPPIIPGGSVTLGGWIKCVEESPAHNHNSCR